MSALALNSYGFTVAVETGTSLADVTAMNAEITPPSGSTITKTLDDGLEIVSSSAGTLAMSIEQGDLAVVGTYRFRVVDVTPGRRIPSTVVNFTVSGS